MSEKALTKLMVQRRDFYRSLSKEDRDFFYAQALESNDKYRRDMTRAERRNVTKLAWRLAWEAGERGDVSPPAPEIFVPQQREDFEERLRQALGSKPPQRLYR